MNVFIYGCARMHYGPKLVDLGMTDMYVHVLVKYVKIWSAKLEIELLEMLGRGFGRKSSFTRFERPIRSNVVPSDLSDRADWDHRNNAPYSLLGFGSVGSLIYMYIVSSTILT